MARQGGKHLRRRLADYTEVPYSVFVPGTSFDGLYTALSHFLTHFDSVARVMDVSDSDVSAFFL